LCEPEDGSHKINISSRLIYHCRKRRRRFRFYNQEMEMGTVMRDLRLALRLLLKSPTFTLITLLALALGIGANTVIFSAFNAIMLRPLPYAEPERIVTVWDSFPKQGVSKFGVAYANFNDLKERNHVFEPLALYVAGSYTAFNLTGLAGPERVQSTRATGDFFRALGVAPLYGRTLNAEDEAQGRNKVVVLGYNLWRRDFGGDARIVNQTIKLNDEVYTVVGVMPPGFAFPSGAEMPAGQQFDSATELWTPLTVPGTPAARNDRNVRAYRAVARLKAGVTVEQAQAETNLIVKQLVAEHADDNEGLNTIVTTMRENQVGDLRPAMLALLGAVGFVLLIACANLANLLLSRAAVRRREFAVRAALGASRRRLLQQLLTESLLLSTTGGLLGLLLSILALRFLVAFAPANIPHVGEVSIDFRVLLFTIAISLATGLLFGLAPALHAARTDLYEGVKEGTRSASGSSGQKRLRSLLVVSEVMLVFVLLFATGLMLKSFRRLLDVAPGFDPAHVLTARVTLPLISYPTPKKLTFYQQLLERTSQQAGVQQAALVRDLPLSGTDPRYGVSVEGRPDDQQAGGGYTVRDRVVSADYFKVMGIPLLKGRYFNAHDERDAPAVAIINESAARKIFPGGDPLGQVLVNNGNYAPARCEIVGVVGDVKFGGLDSQADPEVYVHYPQLPESFMQPGIGSMAMVVRATGEPSSLVSAVRQQVATIDVGLPVSSVLSMDEVLSQSLAPRRFNLLLLTIFGGVALALAAIGIYGVLSYWVAQRTREIGIRMALGAQVSDIFKLVVFQAMVFVFVGLGVGVLVALALARVLSSTFNALLFGVRATDPLMFAVVSLLLAVVALLACFIPARRAVKVNPTVALRYE
jgi:putative ABC transport system permease protein